MCHKHRVTDSSSGSQLTECSNGSQLRENGLSWSLETLRVPAYTKEVQVDKARVPVFEGVQGDMFRPVSVLAVDV